MTEESGSYERDFYDMKMRPWAAVRACIESHARTTGRWTAKLLQSVFITRKDHEDASTWIRRVQVAKTALFNYGWKQDRAIWDCVYNEVAVKQLTGAELLAVKLPQSEALQLQRTLPGIVGSFDAISLQRDSLRSTSATLHPASDSCCATENPMEPVPPVTSATLPASEAGCASHIAKRSRSRLCHAKAAAAQPAAGSARRRDAAARRSIDLMRTAVRRRRSRRDGRIRTRGCNGSYASANASTSISVSL